MSAENFHVESFYVHSTSTRRSCCMKSLHFQAIPAQYRLEPMRSAAFVQQLARRALPASAAATTSCLTVTAFGGERGSCSFTSRASSALATSRTLPHFRQMQPPKQQLLVQRQCRNFSSSASTAEAKVVPPPPPAAASSGGFVAWYEKHLNISPVRTKMITGSILWGLGDVVAQVVPHYAFDDAPPASAPADDSEVDTTIDAPTASAVAGGSKPEFVYDFPRTARAAIFGFAIHAPLSHVHYNFLEWMTVKAGLQGLSIPVFKTVMEQFVYWSWFSNSLYHGTMGAMQGWTAQQCYDRIADVLWDTQKAQWVFWIPVQLINFQFVPVRHQLNVVLLTSVVWTALLSAWYPPAEQEEGGGEQKEEEKE